MPEADPDTPVWGGDQAQAMESGLLLAMHKDGQPEDNKSFFVQAGAVYGAIAALPEQPPADPAQALNEKA